MGRLLLGTLLAAVCTDRAPAPAAPAPAPPDPPPTASAPAEPDPAPTAPAPTEPAPAVTSPADAAATCTDRRTLRRADGSAEDCYPYVCRAGACLTRCAAMTDCAGAHTRAEFPAEGWPLECMPSGQCTPMPPDKVR